MGAYASWNPITGGDVARYLRLEVVGRITGELEAADRDALIEGLIDTAEAEINASLRKAGVTVPAPATPELIDWTATLVAEALYRRAGNVPDEIATAAARVRDELRAIRDGDRAVLDDSGEAVASERPGGAIYSEGDTDVADLLEFGG